VKESKLANQLGLKYPIFQAPIGSMAGVELASAVSNAGGLGSLALTWTPKETAVQLVQTLHAQTKRPFFVNYVLAFPVLSLDEILEAGVRVVTFSWGRPKHLIQKCHNFNTIVGVQVGSGDGAKSVRDAGADFIICQGVEAGGHVQSTTPLMKLKLLDEVVLACPDVPVVAAGGLADGSDIAKALDAGADAVMLGTRFVATVESRAHPLYKKAIVNSTDENAVLTVCFNEGWDNVLHRVLRNSTLINWEDAGCPPVGSRPGELEPIASNDIGKIIRRYEEMPPAFDMSGDILACVLYSGTGCGKINEILSVSDLLPKLWSECLEMQGSN
jgi:nitronate monooxygenase